MQNLFDIESFIFKTAAHIEAPNNYLIIDRLCKKIDVVKSVFKFYTADLSKKQSDEEISTDAYKQLLKLLSNEAIIDFKFLNSALKLNDILLSKSIINSEEQQHNKELLLSSMPHLFALARESHEND